MNWYPATTTKTQIKQIVEDYIYKEWKIAWQAYPGCRQTKFFYPGPSKQQYLQTSRLARMQLMLLIQIITGQNKLNYLTSKINKYQSELCRFCEEESETFIHILSECPVFINLRQEIFGQRAFTQLDTWKPCQLLKFAQQPQIYEALTEDVEY